MFLIIIFLKTLANFWPFAFYGMKKRKNPKILRPVKEKKGSAGPMYFAIYKIIEKRQTKWTKMHKNNIKALVLPFFMHIWNPIHKISN